MIDEKIRIIIDEIADKIGLEADLVEAICMQESSGDSLAVRMEFGFYAKYTKPLNFSDTEEVCRGMSWGLMQIMGQVAREMGYKGRWMTGLLDPRVNIEYGCLHLKHKIDKYGFDGGIAAYNAGSPRIASGKKFVNQHYVDGVLSFLERIKKEGE